MYFMGRAHEFGLGVPKDRAEAIQWYQKSAASGFTPARALGLHRIPRSHQVELEGLDAAAWPENVADYPHVLVPAESGVLALRKTSQIDRDGRSAVGRCQRHRLAAKVDPKDPAVDDQRRLWHGARLGRRLRREDGQEQANEDDPPYPPPIHVAHRLHAFRRHDYLPRGIIALLRRAAQPRVTCAATQRHRPAARHQMSV